MSTVSPVSQDELQAITERVSTLKAALQAGGLDVEVKAELSLNLVIVIKDPKDDPKKKRKVTNVT